MRFVVFLILAGGLQMVCSLSRDQNIRNILQNHFNSTRSNYNDPAAKIRARDYIVETFKNNELDTWTEEFPSNQAGHPGINIIGRVNGQYTGTNQDKILIIAAHYDTVNTTKGVDDNGSGMSALLQALSLYKDKRNCTQKHTLLFVAFDKEEQQPTCPAGNGCHCTGAYCGSQYFVTNLTRFIDSGGVGTVQGAYVMDTISNFNDTPNSQELPGGDRLKNVIPGPVQKVEDNQKRGDFLAVIGRKDDDSFLRQKFMAGFGGQETFKAIDIPLPFNGKPNDQPSPTQVAPQDFTRSDHRSFWNSNHSWPAVFLTDTADFRGFMKTCYHQMCDNMDHVTPNMIKFMSKTADALVETASVLTERNCSSSNYCSISKLITSNEVTIYSPSYHSEYPNGVNCSWFTKSEHSKMLEFTEFDLEDSVNCTDDYVEVIVGDKSIGRYCGSTKPRQINTTQTLRVRFISDAFVSKKGFTLKLTTKAITGKTTRAIGTQSLFIVAMLTAMSIWVSSE